MTISRSSALPTNVLLIYDMDNLNGEYVGYCHVFVKNLEIRLKNQF